MDEQINTENQTSTGVFPGGNTLEEQNNTAPNARPEQYINTSSATIIMLIKLLEGVAAGFFLYHIFRAMVRIIGEVTKGALDVNHALQLFASEYGVTISSDTEKILSDFAVGGFVLSNIIWGGFILVIIIILLLVVVEAIALLEVRIAKKGAGLVKIIHQIYMWVNIGALIFLGISVFEYYKFQQSLKGVSSTAYNSATVLWAAVIFVCVVYALIFIMLLCYHKDIAIAMKTVAYELNTGNQGAFRRTHLSGISIFFSIPFVLTTIALVFGIIRSLVGGESLARTFQVSNVQEGISLVLPVIMMIKYLCIPACYRNLECAREWRDGYTQKTEKSGHFTRNLIIIIIIIIVIAAYFIISKGLYKDILDRFNINKNTVKTEVQTERVKQEKQTEVKKATASVKQTESSKPSDNGNVSGVSTDFKEYMDSYEEFMNQYCDFMESYDQSDANALLEYASLMNKYTEFASKVEKYDETNLSTEDYKYYIDVMSRVNKRLVDVAGKTEQ